MSWGLPGAILFLLGLVLLLGYFLSKKVFPSGETDAPGGDPSGRSPCDGCGEPGCGGFAKALLRGGSTDAGNPATAGEGQTCEFGSGAAQKRPREMKAVVLCTGSRVSFRYRYSGAPSCRAASLMAVPLKECGNACLGFGDCVRSCRLRAIRIEQGIARIDGNRCDGCGRCEPSCPLGLIALIPADRGVTVLCKGPLGPSQDGSCPEGCTACGLCFEACPEGALERTEKGIPQWIEDRCAGCGLCIDACPQGLVLVSGSSEREPGTARERESSPMETDANSDLRRRPARPKDAARHPSSST